MIAPGPSGSALLGNLQAFRRDVLGLALHASRTYGDVVRFRLGPRIVHLVNHPDHIQYVLQRNHRNFARSARSARKIAAVCGESLLTTTGAAWARQRQLVQPAFQPQSVAGFAPMMIDAVSAMVSRWQAAGEKGRPLDVPKEMSRLTFTIVARALFGADVVADADRVAAAMDVLMDATYRRLSRIVDLPAWLPIASNRRHSEARAAIDAVVYRIIGNPRRAPSESHLVATLLGGPGSLDAPALTTQQLRDLTITLLLAGHETTANALAWTLFLLSEHPEVQQRLFAEVERVLSGRPPTIASLQELTFTEMVLYESMRLYPPIWILERHVVQDDEIGGFHIPAGSTVVVSPYTLHRHPRYWPRPDEFVPDRFASGEKPGRAGSAFMPFGAGPHSCIGSHFALIEARLALAMVAQSFHFRPASRSHVVPLGGITLRVRDGLLVHADPRTVATHARVAQGLVS